MKRSRHFIPILLLWAACSPKMSPDQVLVWQPEKPQPGMPAALLYNPASPQAALPSPAQLNARIQILRPNSPPQVIETALEPKGKIWRARFEVPADAQMVLAVLTAAGKSDDRQGQSWESLLYSRDGRTVQGAHLQKSRLLRHGAAAGFPYRTNLREAETELTAELTLYPGNLEARTELWDLLLTAYPAGAMQGRVRTELRQMYENAAGDEEILAALLPFFFRTGQEYIARQIIEESVALLPRGPVARAARRIAIDREDDPQKKAALIAAFVKDFPGESH